MSANDNRADGKKDGNPTVSVTRTSSNESSAPSLKSPRTARFAEATSVNSPIDPPQNSRSPFDNYLRHGSNNNNNKNNDTDKRDSQYLRPQPQPADVGFGYVDGDRNSGSQIGTAVEMPMTPKSPLKSALRAPGTPARKIEQPPNSAAVMSPGSVMSPTWKEEEDLEKQEKKTTKQQAKDLWPTILLLVVASISIVMSVVIMYGYIRGGHRRAEKVAVYYTIFAVGFFTFSIVMWGIGAGALQQSRNSSDGQDIWGWACKNNARKEVFQMDVDYDLICRLLNWSLVCCIIEVVVEVVTIAIYGVVFYRFYSKRKLHKAMDRRDTARSDLYLAQLRSQSAPNTPGLKSPGGPLSPREGGYNPAYSPRFATISEKQEPQSLNAIAAGGKEEEGVRYINAPAKPSSPKPFTLQSAPPPKKETTPKLSSSEFSSATSSPNFSMPAQSQSQQQPSSPSAPLSPNRTGTPLHAAPAPGEQTYESVPIPGAYTSSTPLQSPTGARAAQQSGGFASLH
ncbi:MAG: hypothetical protein M1831_002465 [Alyxoria varia]|nr:MAG: hypothetical protein M1831_002465 [Alyxoria varia]